MKRGILSTIGQTPLIQLNRIYNPSPVELYAKLEMFNPGGSIKDRPALKMVLQAIANGELEEGATVVESSSGNMAIGLAQVCCYHRLNLIVVVDPKINSHTLKVLQTYGVQIDKVTESDDEGNYLAARLRRVRELVGTIPDSYWPNQYENEANPAAHFQTMKEIVEAMPAAPDYLLASTSTCGTIMGCANYVKQHQLNTKIVAVDAVGSVLFGTPPADRLVPGHGAGQPSNLLDMQVIDHVIHIDDEECISGCHRLLDREAILAGGSSGAVVKAVEKLLPNISEDERCALILPDSGERYLDTIYNQEWLAKHFGEQKATQLLENTSIQQKVERALSYSIPEVTTRAKKLINADKEEGTRKIAIIGGGPKGMYGFERLAAQFCSHPVDCDIEIHVYNKSAHFGAGDIYRLDQPDYLLINNPIGDINMWIDEQPAPVDPHPLSLTHWLQKEKKLDVTENDYVGRALVGQYLEKGFETIVTHLPARVSGKYFAAEVIDISRKGKRYELKVRATSEQMQNMPHRYDHILLATGHPNKKLTKQEKAFGQFAEQRATIDYVPFVYPVDSSLSGITPGSRVGIKGIGLTFIDAMLALTEGRGGIFKRDSKQDKLIYEPSGKEPEVIYPFSRSGLPMIPRGPAPQNEVPLKFFTIDALRELKIKAEGKLDFKKQIRPLLYREMIYAFYNIQMEQKNFKNNLQSCATFAEVKHHIRAFHEHNPNAAQFSPDLFLRPLKGRHFNNTEYFDEDIRLYLAFFIAEARKGELKSPWAAASAVWRKATPVFGSIYEFGGLAPISQKYFDEKFRRLLNRVTFGPPIESVEKMLALMEAGKLNFRMARNPGIEASKKSNTFMLRMNDEEPSQPVEGLVDARIPKVSMRYDQSPLYRNLLDRGLITRYQNEQGQDSYQPGCAALSPEGFVIDGQGNINPCITLTGTPTEGITFDNDALSRTRNNFVSDWAACIRKLHAQSSVNHYASCYEYE